MRQLESAVTMPQGVQAAAPTHEGRRLRLRSKAGLLAGRPLVTRGGLVVGGTGTRGGASGCGVGTRAGAAGGAAGGR
jgi:hypothetical protein